MIHTSAYELQYFKYLRHTNSRPTAIKLLKCYNVSACFYVYHLWILVSKRLVRIFFVHSYIPNISRVAPSLLCSGSWTFREETGHRLWSCPLSSIQYQIRECVEPLHTLQVFFIARCSDTKVTHPYTQTVSTLIIKFPMCFKYWWLYNFISISCKGG